MYSAQREASQRKQHILRKMSGNLILHDFQHQEFMFRKIAVAAMKRSRQGQNLMYAIIIERCTIEQ